MNTTICLQYLLVVFLLFHNSDDCFPFSILDYFVHQYLSHISFFIYQSNSYGMVLSSLCDIN